MLGTDRSAETKITSNSPGSKLKGGIVNALEDKKLIERNIRQTLCWHGNVTPLSEESKIVGINNPITCDHCGKILECEHEYEYKETQCWVCGEEKI